MDFHLAISAATGSTRRQRRWALADLVSFTGPVPAVQALSGPSLQAWLVDRAGPARTTPLPSLRARASSARALLDHAVEFGILTRQQSADARALLALPAPTQVAEAAPDAAVRRLLTASVSDAPAGITYANWDRFGAHLRLLAQTGLPERALAHVRLEDLAGKTLTLPGGTWTLTQPTNRAVAQWLERRASIVDALQGSDPGALWLRVAPAGRPDGSTAPAGLPISQRGLRMAFATCVAALRAEDEQLDDIDIASVRRQAARTQQMAA